MKNGTSEWLNSAQEDNRIELIRFLHRKDIYRMFP